MPDVIIYETDPLIAEDVRGITAMLKPEWRAAVFDDAREATDAVSTAETSPCLLIARSVEESPVSDLLDCAARRRIPTVLIADESVAPLRTEQRICLGEPFTNASLAEAIAAALHA